MYADIFQRALGDHTQIDVPSMIVAMPETDIVLPDNKIIGFNAMPIYGVHAAVITISRDAFNIGMAFERLETINNHARHLLIDRNGRIYQAAGLTTPLRHIHLPNSSLGNDNTIAIELINCGVIQEKRIRHKRLAMHDSDGIFRYKLPRCNVTASGDGYYYETFPYEQIQTLEKLINQLRELQPYIELLSGSHWQSTAYYKLTPVFPFGKFGMRR